MLIHFIAEMHVDAQLILIILIISALIGFSIRDYKDMHGKIVKMDLWGNIFITVSLFAFFSAVAFTIS